MKKTVLCLATATLFFYACKKDNSSNPTTTYTNYIAYGGDTTELDNGFFSPNTIFLTNFNLKSKTDSGLMTMIRIYAQIKNSGIYTYKNANDATYDQTRNFYAVQFTPSGNYSNGGITEYQDLHGLTSGTLNLQLGADSVYQISYDLTLSDALKGKVTGKYTGKLIAY
jgi:hypothetical protein